MCPIKNPSVGLPKSDRLTDTFERPEQIGRSEHLKSNNHEKKHILKVNPDLWFEELVDKTNCTTFEREITCRNLNLLKCASRFIGKQKLKLKHSRSTETKSKSLDLFKIPDGSNELEQPPVSWEVDADHPLKSSLTPGPPSNSCLSNNWYQRLNWVWKDRNENIDNGVILEDPQFIEHDLAFIKELGYFYSAARTAAIALLHCHPSFNYGIAKAYYEITKFSNENLWSIYKPLFADDRVFVFDSIVFTIILGDKKNGISREIAKRLYNNEFKSKKAFCDILIQIGPKALFALPICTLIKYMGYTVFCEPLVPFIPKPKDVLKDLLNKCSIPRNMISTLDDKYEENDDLSFLNNKSRKEVRTLFDALLSYNPDLASQMNFIAKQLNIQGWPFPMETTDLYEHYGIKYNFKIWQHRSDGLYITRHCGEMLPVYIDENKEVQPLRRLREEFLITYTYSSLPSTISIPPFLNTITGDPTNYYLNNKISHFLNESDRNNSVSRHSVLYYASQDMRIRLLKDLLPTINELYLGFHDPWEITELLHNYGINLNYGLGKLAQSKVIEPIRNTAIREILARTIKRLWEEEMHISFQDQTLVNEETIQIILIDYFNKILCNTDESNIYWNSKIVPSAIKRFQLNKLTMIINKSNVQLTPLFYSLQFHIGVQFNTKVVNSDGTLRLPLKIDDLCDYTEINTNIDFLFPQVKYIKYTLAHTQKLRRDSLNEAVKNIKQKHSPILNLFGNYPNKFAQNTTRSYNLLDSSNNQVWAWNETGIIRGYYPKIKIILPRTLKSINICKTILCKYIWKLGIPTWNKIFISSCKDFNNGDNVEKNIFSSSSILFNPIYGNIVTMGNISPLKASLYGYATPCHPSCRPITKSDHKINKMESNIKCQIHYDSYKSLYYLIISKRLVGESIERIMFILLNIGYLALQHNNLDECLSICQVSQSCTPEIPKFQVLILALKIQCLIRYNKYDEANSEFNYLKKLVYQLYGNHRNCLMLIKLQLCFSALYFVNKDYQECYNNSKLIEQILTPLLSEVSENDSTHWMIIIALRFIALSSLQLGNYAQSIVIGEKMLRSTIKDSTKQIYLESICRYIIGEATIRCGRYDNALKMLINCIPELDRFIGPTHKFTIKLLMMSTRCKIILGCRDLMFPPLNLQDRDTEIDNDYQYQMVYDLFCIEREQFNDNDILSTSEFNINEQFINLKPYWTRFPTSLIYDDILTMEKSIFDKKTAKYREEALLMCRSLINRILSNIRGTGNILNVNEDKHEHEQQIWYNRILWVLKHEIVISLFSLTQNDYIKLLSSIRSIAVSTSASPFVKDLTFGKKIDYQNRSSNYDKTQIQNTENKLNNNINIPQRIINKRIIDFTDCGYIDYCNINTNIHDNIISKNIIESGIGNTSNYFGATVIMSPRQMGHRSQEKEIYWNLLISDPTMNIVDICGEIYKQLVNREITSAYEWCTTLIRKVSSGKATTAEINISLNLIRLLLSKFHKKYMISLLYPDTMSKSYQKTNRENNLVCNLKNTKKPSYGLEVYQNYYYENDNNESSNNHYNEGSRTEGVINISKDRINSNIYQNDKDKNNINDQYNNLEPKIDYSILPRYDTRVAANLMLPINQGNKVIDINKDIRWKDPYRNYKYYDSQLQTKAQLYIPKDLYLK